MSKDSKTPQAFPYSGEGDELNYSRGMTLRDYFAATAVVGMLQVTGYATNKACKDAAECAYGVADAMLKARQA